MRITQWGEYGVHCLVFMAIREAAGDQSVTAAEFAEDQGIALDYTQQILQRLRRGGLIQSIRGPQGGYKLARKATEITLKEVLIAAEGATFEVICEVKPVNHERCVAGAPCAVRPLWYALQQHVDTFLNGITLQDVVDHKIPDPIQAEPMVRIGAGSAE